MIAAGLCFPRHVLDPRIENTFDDDSLSLLQRDGLWRLESVSMHGYFRVLPLWFTTAALAPYLLGSAQHGRQ